MVVKNIQTSCTTTENPELGIEPSAFLLKDNCSTVQLLKTFEQRIYFFNAIQRVKLCLIQSLIIHI